MSLIKFATTLKRSDPLARVYKGIVFSNTDPQKHGRVKCLIPGLIEAEVDSLPWFHPQRPAFLGGRQDLGSFAVPSLGTEVTIEFPFKDIYAGFYTGVWDTDDTHPASFDEDYPDSYGFRDKQGTGFKVNQAKQIAEFLHTSGAQVSFERDGTVELRSPKVIKFVSADDKTVLEFDLNSGNINLAAKDEFTLSGQKGTIDPQLLSIKSARVVETIGSKLSTVTGGVKQVVGGSSTEAIVGSKAITIGQMLSTLVSMTEEKTVGLGVNRTIATVGVSDTVLLGNYLTTLLAGLYQITASLSIGLTSALSVDLTGAAAINLITAALTETVGALTQAVAGVYTMTAGGAASMTAGAALTLTGGGAASLIGATAIVQGATVLVGPGVLPSPVLTLINNPLVDNITGAPSIGTPSVLCG